MAQYAFYFDQTRCMSCNSCTVACKDWNQIEPGPVAWRKQFTYEYNGNFFPLSLGCNHCEEPACIKACGYGAISKDPVTGSVYVNRSLCNNLQGCITACPFGKTLIADDKQEKEKDQYWRIAHPMQKCDMCRARVVNGEKPVCVASCVGRAMDFGTIEEITAKYTDIVRLNPSDFPYAYINNTNDTKPSVFIKKKINHIAISATADGYNG